jgi:hypothetical protein
VTTGTTHEERFAALATLGIEAKFSDLDAVAVAYARSLDAERGR